ncbi:GNAT family N-acetyltransferase [Clostridium argentinense]|nr:GNAT family N-acetyltransferase [Clostridium argentinense]NFF39701.1 GNAT family N-acetyltransferase [Clostridium argentinense]NFP49701.1 GNAT family N-acetyltransferase [Clostridium argentinense]NFP72102.1 GNAT family N-acetyltransferase [Clostridium argentinense]NFP76803.1 GNAT family N-acetyltransferase [Clostridium argentinense]
MRLRGRDEMFVDARIETNRLLIRPYSLEDAERIYQIVGEKNFYKYIPEDVPSLDEVKDIIKWSIDCCKKNTPDKIYKFNLAIIHKDDNKVIGYCGLGPDDLNLQEVELYYGLSNEYRSQGLASEAAYALVEYGFKVIKLKKIIGLVDAENTHSIKLVEKLGMKYHFKIKDLPKNLSYFENLSYYSILREEFIK